MNPLKGYVMKLGQAIWKENILANNRFSFHLQVAQFSKSKLKPIEMFTFEIVLKFDQYLHYNMNISM